MQARRLSRRDALRSAFRGGGALALAAAVGCDVRASSESTPVSIPPSPETGETPRTAVTAVAAPKPPEALRRDIVPTRLTILRAGIDALVGEAATAWGADGHLEVVVPESGVVTPNPRLGGQSVNNAWIVGHSRWHRVPQLLYTLPLLDVGDRIGLEGTDGASGRAWPALTFEVERLMLTDTETTARLVYGPTPRVPRLILQTSARQTYDPEWILDEQTVLGKAEVDLAGRMDDLTRYLLYLVVARIGDTSLVTLASSS